MSRPADEDPLTDDEVSESLLTKRDGASREEKKRWASKDTEIATDAPFESVDDALEEIGFGSFQWKLLLLCGMGNLVEACTASLLRSCCITHK